MLTANGNLIVGRSNSEELQTSVSGKLRINRFSLLDKANAEGLLKWNTLSVTGIEARSAPLSLHIRDITLSNFNSQITVNEDRTINLLEASKSGTTEPDNNQKIVNKTASEADKQPQSQPHTVRIDKIVLQKGEVAVVAAA